MRKTTTLKLQGHSDEELIFTAYLLDAIEMLTLEDFATCLERGNEVFNSDAVIDGLGCAVEWDGNYYHNKIGSADRDVRKTRKLLSAHDSTGRGTLVVVRRRVGDLPPLPELEEEPGCVIIQCTGPSPEKALCRFADAMHARVPPPFAKRLERVVCHAKQDPDC